MMKKFLIISAGVAAMLSLFTSCNDAKYQPISSNMMYIAQSSDANQSAADLTVKEGKTKISLQARLSQSATKEVNVTFKVDEQFLKDYNAKYGKSYKLLPAQYLKVLTTSGSVKIASGKTTSDDAFEVEVDGAYYPEITEDGSEYCVPVSIESNDGGYELTETSSHIIYVLKPTHRQYTPNFQNASNSALDFKAEGTLVKVEDKPDEVVNGFAVEGWIYMDAMGATKVFGTDIFDVSIADEGGSYILKVKSGTGNEGIDEALVSRTRLEAKKWYHVAYSYSYSGIDEYDTGKTQDVIDKETGKPILGEDNKPKQEPIKKPFYKGKYSLFVDGAEEAAVTVYDTDSWFDKEIVDKPIQIGIKGKTYATKNLTLFADAEGQMAQVKLWTKSIGSGDINGGKSGEIKVDPKGPKGLYGYWKMDKSDIKDNTILDATAGKHDLTVSTVKWSETRVDFSAPNP